MNTYKPMLFTCLKNYTKAQFVRDLVSGLIVAIIALPLSIALAIASNVPPEMGLFTAIVAGFIISFLGGSPVQIAGPTAAFATIVAGIVATNGLSGLAVATVMAGAILIIMGLCRLGTLIKFIPHTITVGFTAGIAVTILLGQLKDFFGVSYPVGFKAPIEAIEKVEALIGNFGTFNVWAFVVGVLSLLILFLFPKVTTKIPSSLVAVVFGVCAYLVLGDKITTIGTLYEIKGGLPSFTMPDFSFANIKALLPDAFTIAILAAIESLLACVAADGMVGTKHRPNAELIAQGAGNIGSAFFGGIPATGAIARTAANIKNGGRTPVAGMVHAVVLLVIMLVLMPLAAKIPMATIAAILIQVAYNMSHMKPFAKICKTAHWTDITVLVVTFVLTVVKDLVVAIAVGMALYLIFKLIFRGKKKTEEVTH